MPNKQPEQENTEKKRKKPRFLVRLLLFLLALVLLLTGCAAKQPAEEPNTDGAAKQGILSAFTTTDLDGNTVTVHIGRIREKIEEDPQNPKIIETIWGAGYRLNLPEEK